VSLPTPPDPAWPRYAPRLALPPYPFIPGRAPHPRRDPAGHAFGRPEPSPPRLPPDQWRRNEAYLFGVDLYNFACWWESHELWEALWRHEERDAPAAQFLQGLIQVAAANIARFLGRPSAAKAEEAARRLDAVAALHPVFMGLAVADHARATRACHVDGSRAPVPLIRLEP
jgi:hypothetical protein